MLLEPLGRGGMGEGYNGFDETLKRRVALKAIRAEHRLSPQARTRFLREAQILSQLDHPQICRIFDYVEGPDADYLVLEFIDGPQPARGDPQRARAGAHTADRGAGGRGAGGRARRRRRSP